MTDQTKTTKANAVNVGTLGRRPAHFFRLVKPLSGERVDYATLQDALPFYDAEAGDYIEEHGA